MVEEKSILKTILFHNFSKWDVKQFFMKQIKSSYPITFLSELLNEETEKKKLSKFPNEDFGILGISNEEGMFDAYTEKGKNINQPYKIIKNDFIAYNPYRVNVGSIGIKKEHLKNEYISNAYVVFSTKENLLADYLFLLMHTNKFNQLIRDNTTGSVRQTLSFENLGKIAIPVPSIPEQKAIVQKYQDTISKAESIEKEAEKLIIFKENYIQNILGIPLIDDTIQSTLLSYSKFSDLLEKWTISPLQSEINEKLRLSKYRLDKISSLNCVTRSWKKKEYKEKKFDYIEIGGINPETEEISSVQLEVSKAPSRATQLVYKGDLIFGMTRPYLKKFAIVDTAHDGFICSSGFQVIQPSENYNLHFILELLKSNVCISQFKEAMTGALYPALNAEQLGNIRIPLPPLPVQNEIVEHINQIKAQVKDLRQQAKELREKAKLEFERSVFE